MVWKYVIVVLHIFSKGPWGLQSFTWPIDTESTSSCQRRSSRVNAVCAGPCGEQLASVQWSSSYVFVGFFGTMPREVVPIQVEGHMLQAWVDSSCTWQGQQCILASWHTTPWITMVWLFFEISLTYIDFLVFYCMLCRAVVSSASRTWETLQRGCSFVNCAACKMC
jgi:hypothetical protein